MKSALVVLATVLALGCGAYVTYTIFNEEDESVPTAQNTPTPTDEKATSAEEPAPASFDFVDAKKSAHYVSNTPGHGTVLDSAPTHVSLTFNFDLSPASSVSVMKNGQEVSTGMNSVSADKLVLTKTIVPNAGPGLYSVIYNACWPDGSCHDGQFQFGVKQ